MTERKCEIKRDARGRVIYQPGDIVGVWGSGIAGWASRTFIRPSTPMFHFLLIGDVVPGYTGVDDIFRDFVTLESVGKGVTIGRLSWYKNRSYNVYRLNRHDSDNIGYKAFTRASRFGRHGYDWFLALGMAITFIRHGFRPLFVGEIPYQRDNKFLCTELVFEAYRLAGVQLRQSNHAPLPGEIVLAERRGQIVKIDHHDGDPAVWRAPVNQAGLVKVRTYEVDKTSGADAETKPEPFTVKHDYEKGSCFLTSVGGDVIRVAVGEDLKAGDLVAVNDDDGKVYRFQPSEAEQSPPAPAPEPKPSMTPTYVGLLRHGQHGERERSHIFAQPEGRPVRVCNSERVDETDFRPLYIASARLASVAADVHDGMRGVLTCQKCLKMLASVYTNSQARDRIFPKTYYTGRA